MAFAQKRRGEFSFEISPLLSFNLRRFKDAACQLRYAGELKERAASADGKISGCLVIR